MEEKNIKHSIQYIGNVPLILDNYSGRDDYNDGDFFEEFLLETTKENGDIDYSGIIAQNPFASVLYHLSHLRENILCWYPFSDRDSVLEIGSGCGALTGVLARNCGKVDCVDLSKRRCMCNAYRHCDFNNLRIFVSNFEDFAGNAKEKYSIITLIGVLEYSQAYINSRNPFVDMLKMARRLMSDNGRLLIAIENKFGLKYFAGAREDHLCSFFKGIEGYSGKDFARTFSRRELDMIGKKAGFAQINFYYPYPDYKFPTAIFSDDRLPQKGELVENRLSIIHDRYELFDECKAYDNIIDAGMFPEFSNSFLLELKV